MRLLVVVPYSIIPAETGGPIRVNELVRGVSGLDVSVTVVMPMTFEQFSGLQIHDRLRLDVVPYPFVLPLLFTNRPFSYNYLMSLHPGYRRLLKKKIDEHDIVQFEGASFGDLAESISQGKRVIYDAHNVESDYEACEDLGCWSRTQSVKRIRSLEERLTRRADCILTCSRRDSKRMSELYRISPEKCFVIPNGIHVNNDITGMTETEVRAKFPAFLDFSHRAIFSGSDVAHNRLAVQFIIESLAPMLRSRCAFLFKGSCGRRFKQHGAGNLFFDPVPGSAGTYANVCTVALNPVTRGSGTSLKVLDYLAHGIPVLSTEFGMRGFEDLFDYVTVSGLPEFADHLGGGIRYHPQTRTALERYDWKNVAKKLRNTYRSLMEDRKPCP